jgi:hypothetical protein
LKTKNETDLMLLARYADLMAERGENDHFSMNYPLMPPFGGKD